MKNLVTSVLFSLSLLAISPFALAYSPVHLFDLSVTTANQNAGKAAQQFTISDEQGKPLLTINEKLSAPKKTQHYDISEKNKFVVVSAPNVLGQGQATCPTMTYPHELSLLVFQSSIANLDEVFAFSGRGPKLCGTFYIPRA